MNMLPGLGGMGGQDEGIDYEQTADERKMGRMEAIIHSMTPAGKSRIRISLLHPESTELPKVQGWTSAK